MYAFWESMSIAFVVVGTLALSVFGVGGCIERESIRKFAHVENMAKMGFTLTNPEHAIGATSRLIPAEVSNVSNRF